MRKLAVSRGHRDYLSFHGAPGCPPWGPRPVLVGQDVPNIYPSLLCRTISLVRLGAAQSHDWAFAGHVPGGAHPRALALA